MYTNRITFIALLLATLMFNTGCVTKYFDFSEEEAVVTASSTTEPRVVLEVIPPPIIVNQNPEVECSDEATSEKNDCDRGKITKDQLQPSVAQSSAGEVHKLTSIQGHTIHVGERSNGFTFPEYAGKVVVLEMFGKDCPHCIKEIPTIDRIIRRYRGKVAVIAIQSQNRMARSVARNYLRKYRIRYPIIEGDDATNLQFFIQQTYGWTGILPYTLVIKNGVTEFSYSGEVSYNEIKHDIDSLFRK
ncbi:MAG TPA: TlpA family protein disulfide reductase [Campylobacterales bacterium]|nr:TlpA family protein disulfide reductase [Campylobacterales bacterium]